MPYSFFQPQVHYLGDPSRGSVWEEVIINCPRHIKLLAMSATVKNPDDLGGWIGQVGARLCVALRVVRVCNGVLGCVWGGGGGGYCRIQLLARPPKTLMTSAAGSDRWVELQGSAASCLLLCKAPTALSSALADVACPASC